MDNIEKNIIVEYDNQYITMSNSLLRAREKTNLLESKIEILAIHQMDTMSHVKEKKDTHGNIYHVKYVKIRANQIQTLMGRFDGKTYTEIRNAAFSLKEKLYLIEDKKNERFILSSMYGDVSYDNGVLTIEFNPDMETYFLGLKENFTKLNLPILFSFKKNGGFQLYKMLESYAYKLPPIDSNMTQQELPIYRISLSTVDLRMALGYVDINQPKLKQEAMKKRPNFEKMGREEKKPQYKRWTDFQKRVLEPGIEEINQLSDIYIKEMRKETNGRGGKISGVSFYIQRNLQYYKKTTKMDTDTIKPVNLMGDELYEFVDEVRDIIPYHLKTKEYISIAKASSYDLEKIKYVSEIAQSSKTEIKNIVGFYVAALKENYSKNSGVKNTPMQIGVSFSGTDNHAKDAQIEELLKSINKKKQENIQKMKDAGIW